MRPTIAAAALCLLAPAAAADQPAHLFSGIPVPVLLARVGVRAEGD